MSHEQQIKNMLAVAKPARPAKEIYADGIERGRSEALANLKPGDVVGDGSLVAVPRQATEAMLLVGGQAVDDYYHGTKDGLFLGSLAAAYGAMVDATKDPDNV